MTSSPAPAGAIVGDVAAGAAPARAGAGAAAARGRGRRRRRSGAGDRRPDDRRRRRTRRWQRCGHDAMLGAVVAPAPSAQRSCSRRQSSYNWALSAHADEPRARPPADPRRATWRMSSSTRSATGSATAASPPGDKLPTEAAIMAEFGVSRTVDARGALEAAGRRPGRDAARRRHLRARAAAPGGLPASTPASSRPLTTCIAMLELRISLETEARRPGRRSAAREDQLAAMREALDEFDASVDARPGHRGARFPLPPGDRARRPAIRYFADIMMPPRHDDHSARPASTRRASRRGAAAAYLRRCRTPSTRRIVRRDRATQDAEAARAAMRIHLANSRERSPRAPQAQRLAATRLRASIESYDNLRSAAARRPRGDQPMRALHRRRPARPRRSPSLPPPLRRRPGRARRSAIIVPYTPGGSSDIIARAISQPLQDALKQTGDRREQARRQRQHRHRLRRQVAGRRLHAAALRRRRARDHVRRSTRSCRSIRRRTCAA